MVAPARPLFRFAKFNEAILAMKPEPRPDNDGNPLPSRELDTLEFRDVRLPAQNGLAAGAAAHFDIQRGAQQDNRVRGTIHCRQNPRS